MKRETEIDFFSEEKRFIETANRVKILSRCEKECAGSEPEGEINRAENFKEDARPRGNFPGNGDLGTAARVAAFKRRDRADDMFAIDPGIGIDEKQNVATRLMAAGITRSGDLPSIDGN